MSSVIPARRRAEEFAALVDGASDPAGTRHEDLVELVTLLRGTPLVTPRAEFVSELRDALMAEADVALAPVDSKLALRTHTRTRRDRRWAIAAGTAVLLGTGTSMAVASQDALPGDALYPIKRVLEGAQTTLQVDEISKGEALLSNASGRLDEASALRDRGTAASDAALPRALDDFASQSRSAADVLLDEYADTGDEQAIIELREFTRESMDRLVELADDLPSSARTSLEHAAQALKEIDDRARAACPDCPGDALEIPAIFLRSFSDLATPSSIKVGPPVVIEPLAPVADEDEKDSGSSDATADEKDDEPSLLPDSSDDGDGGETPLKDVTDTLLGEKKASLPGEPVEKVTEDVVDPLLGGILP